MGSNDRSSNGQLLFWHRPSNYGPRAGIWGRSQCVFGRCRGVRVCVRAAYNSTARRLRRSCCSDASLRRPKPLGDLVVRVISFSVGELGRHGAYLCARGGRCGLARYAVLQLEGWPCLTSRSTRTRRLAWFVRRQSEGCRLRSANEKHSAATREYPESSNPAAGMRLNWKAYL